MCYICASFVCIDAIVTAKQMFNTLESTSLNNPMNKISSESDKKNKNMDDLQNYRLAYLVLLKRQQIYESLDL